MLKISSSSTHHPLHSRRRSIRIPFGATRFLAAFEGIEGGFAIGAGIIAGLSVSGLNKSTLFSVALISVIVSGFNSASVKYSSEHYLDELDGHEKKSPMRYYFMPAAIEFVSYFAISFVSVFPLLLPVPTYIAVLLCIGVTLALLFTAGYWRGYLLRASSWKDGIEMIALGIGIILVGYISGLLLYSL